MSSQPVSCIKHGGEHVFVPFAILVRVRVRVLYGGWWHTGSPRTRALGINLSCWWTTLNHQSLSLVRAVRFGYAGFSLGRGGPGFVNFPRFYLILSVATGTLVWRWLCLLPLYSSIATTRITLCYIPLLLVVRFRSIRPCTSTRKGFRHI